MQAPGRTFLLVTGIMYIVSGSIDIIGGLFLDGLAQTVGGLGNMFGVQGAGARIEGFAFFSVVLGAYNFVVGIMGVSNRDNLEKGGTLMTLGITSIIVSFILHIVLGTLSFTMLLFFAIPICYIIGARKNKQACEAIFHSQSTAYSQHKYDKSDSVQLSPPPYAQTETSQAEVSPEPILPKTPVVPGEQDIQGEHGVFRAHLGLFRELANAQVHLARLKSAGFNPVLEPFNSPQHGTVIRVLILGVKASERLEIAQRLKNAGFKGTWIRG